MLPAQLKLSVSSSSFFQAFKVLNLKKKKKRKWEKKFGEWINIKSEFSNHYQTKMRGMAGMLKYLRLELVGRHHSGIDDCRNISSIVLKMLQVCFSSSLLFLFLFPSLPFPLPFSFSSLSQQFS